MLFVIVRGPTYAQAREEIGKAEQAAGVELRLDCFEKIDLMEIEGLMQGFSLPCIFTLRKKSQGGAFCGSEEERFAFVEELLALRPAFFDLEYDTPHSFLEKVAEQFPETKILLSYHNFEKTPDLEPLLLSMQSPCVYAYKIACHAEKTLDALRMLAFVRANTTAGKKMIGISLGEKGTLTRILAPIGGSILTYAPLNDVLPGQLTVSELCVTYHYHTLNFSSEIYALIGDPVENSCSHIAHNQRLREENINAVYVKIPLSKEELASCFPLLQSLPFKGISVTMPHKETVIPFLDRHETSGTVNTILFCNGKMIGHNTDGSGALDAIEAKAFVKNKRILLLGAGGTARAIAFEAKKRGAHLTIVNRTLERAKKLAEQLDCPYFSLADVSIACSKGYDILIHATSVGMAPNVDAIILHPANLLSNKIVMDVVSHPKKTRLLQEAEQKGCTLVYGEELFARQAQGQFDFWNPLSKNQK